MQEGGVGAHLEGDGGEAAEAHELRDVDGDGDAAGQQQADERRPGELVGEDPIVADGEVDKRADHQQRPPLHERPAARSAAARALA